MGSLFGTGPSKACLGHHPWILLSMSPRRCDTMPRQTGGYPLDAWRQTLGSVRSGVPVSVIMRTACAGDAGISTRVSFWLVG